MESDDSQNPTSFPTPHPLESLHETPVPPFLSKTFDLVDDPSLDAIICWGANGDSFVVKDHVEFARTILPMNFKHNNFSSFVRQLNTYGFRKIDADTWEFATEGFMRGHRHLLKTIQRRKSHHSHQSEETGKTAALEGEIERLAKERSLMMQEVIELQNQQRGTIQHIELVNQKLQTAETKQKQMVSFLGNIFQNPACLARLQQKAEQNSITSPRTHRKFVKHEPSGLSGSSPKGQILKYENELVDPFIGEQLPVHQLQGIGNYPAFGTVNLPFQVGDVSEHNLAMAHEFLEAPEGVSTKGKGIVGPPPPQSSSEYFISVPDDVAMGKNIPEFSVPGSGSMAMGDDIWSMGFEAGSGMLSSTELSWGNISNYDMAEIGGLSDAWNIGAGSSGNEKWPDELEKHGSLFRDDDDSKK